MKNRQPLNRALGGGDDRPSCGAKLTTMVKDADPPQILPKSETYGALAKPG